MQPVTPHALSRPAAAPRPASRRTRGRATVFRSPFPARPIPEASLPAYVFEHTDRHAGRPALVDGPSGRALTHGALRARARTCAAGLQARGLAPGEVVGIYSPNHPDYAVAYLGVALAGGANTTANALYTADELAFQLGNARARYLIAHPALLARALEAAAAAGVEEVFVFGEADGATPFETLLDAGDPRPVALDPAVHTVSLPYSSGTTGFPKGVRLTHRNLVANLHQIEPSVPIRAGDVVIGVLPFFHVYGQTVVMNAGLRAGATIVTMPRFDLEQFLSLIETHQVTRAFVAPPIVVALAKHPLVERFDLSSLRQVSSGAAPLDADLSEAAAARIGCPIAQGYGLTEASPVIAAVPEGWPNRPGSIGPLVEGTEARVVDPETGRDVGPGEPGELWARGPQVMAGYLGNGEATRATLVEGGWLRTGDVVTADADGWFTVVDRLKELIKVKGYQVAPAELEALLLTHQGVADACVIPVRDDEAGERPKAFVVLRCGADCGEILSWAVARLAPHKRIVAVEAIEQVPKSPSGKILRRVLVERERSRRNAAAPPA
jgi:acyl-CoA synthetase (AMP-forming)/AMP-acid ligase II